MSSVKSMQIDPNITAKQAAAAAQKTAELQKQANTDNSVSRQQLEAYKATLDANDLGGA